MRRPGDESGLFLTAYFLVDKLLPTEAFGHLEIKRLMLFVEIGQSHRFQVHWRKFDTPTSKQGSNFN